MLAYGRFGYTPPMTRYSHTSAFHTMHVYEHAGARILQFERNRQSSMLLDDPYETDIEYVAYLHLTLAVTPHATRTLVIGLGGGSLVKRMWRDYPWMSIDAVELDAEVVEVARAFFELPEDDDRLRVIVGDGRAHLERTAQTYDIVVIDAFDDDHIPRPLTTDEFLRTVRGRLSADGVVAYNVIGALSGPTSRSLRALYRTMANVWRRVWLFTVNALEPGGIQPENVVILASDAPLSDEELLARIASRADGRVGVPGFETFGRDLHTAPVRLGDVPILTDPPGRRRT